MESDRIKPGDRIYDRLNDCNGIVRMLKRTTEEITDKNGFKVKEINNVVYYSEILSTGYTSTRRTKVAYSYVHYEPDQETILKRAEQIRSKGNTLNRKDEQPYEIPTIAVSPQRRGSHHGV